MPLTSTFKFKSSTALPDKLDDFWWHDEFAVKTVEIERVEAPASCGSYVVKFIIEEPFYVASGDDEDDRVPDDWEPSAVTFVLQSPVSRGAAECIKDEVIRMVRGAYIDAPEISGDVAKYDLGITYSPAFEM